MLHFLAVACCFALASAKVDFTYSTIYDEYDLNTNKEIPLSACGDGGCSVYVSVSNFDTEVTKNLFVYSKDAGTNVSLYPFAVEYDPITGTKNGLHLSNKVYSIMNYNGNNAVANIVIYVIGAKAPYYGATSVAFYDAFRLQQRQANNKMLTVIMSPRSYNLFAQSYGDNLQAYIRATGPDENFDQAASPSDCRVIYQHNANQPFRLRIGSPIITIGLQSRYNTQICANDDQYNGAPLDYAGIATSQGYVGCKNNNYQTYRSSLYKSTSFELLDSAKATRQVELTYAVATKNTDKLTFAFYENANTPPAVQDVTGDGKTTTIITKNAYDINMAFLNQFGSSYWVSYVPKSGAVAYPSGEGMCADYVPTVPTITATAPSPAPTTSVASGFTTLLSAATLCLARFLQ